MNTPSSEDAEGRPESDDQDADGTGVATVELPARLVSRVEGRLDRTQYDTADEYVAFVLEETLARVEAATDDDPVDLDEDEIHDRLESLGYLDS